jgi:molecular chaperone Hsp33
MTDTPTATITDSAVRAITEDGAFRIMVVRTTDTVREICRLQEADGLTARNLADLVTATVLIRETMAPGFRVQGILRAVGNRGTLIADSAPAGNTRGLVQLKDEQPVLVENGAVIQMMRTLMNGSVHQGFVEVPSGGGITQAIMAYMMESEQVDTMLAVGTVLGDDGCVLHAGGYMVQLLPEVGRGPLAIMTERLEDFRTIEHLLDANFTPEWLRDELLYRMPFAALDKTPVQASCWCSESRLLGALSTLDRSEVEAMIADGTPLEIRCDYCVKQYLIAPARLTGLLGQS